MCQGEFGSVLWLWFEFDDTPQPETGIVPDSPNARLQCPHAHQGYGGGTVVGAGMGGFGFGMLAGSAMDWGIPAATRASEVFFGGSGGGDFGGDASGGGDSGGGEGGGSEFRGDS